ncbi:MAG TPA: helix-turn-helix transcriptional regulator [Bradyrhizobium sp.]|jgi:AraC-like DNA-binding protein/mannose-6-phosphate isomerase-like protein (cupin superfamily)|nr:helix-turn-helix transcriptional regulator [Bradyrhizobium sp.]
MNSTHPEVLIAPTGNSARRVVAYVLDLQRGGGRPPHKHDRAQLLAVTSGSIAVVAEGATFVAPPERGVWVPAHTLHETRHLASTRLRTLYIEAGACGALPDRTTVVQINPLMRELLSAIVARPREYEEQGADGRLVDVMLDQIANSRALPLNLPIPSSAQLRAVAMEILEWPTRGGDIHTLSSSVHMSARTLQRQFKSETGLSLRSFRRQAKLLKALELLSARTPVSKISDQLGFGEPSAFISMFRAAYGVTPGRYLSQD